MTTIKLKNGSGAPAGGDLTQGEPALDLTNKRLYTENASGTVIEVGTNPTSITTGSITATDAVDINSSVDISGNLNMSGSGLIRTNDGTAALPGIRIGTDNDNGLYRPASNEIGFSTAGTERMRINGSGIDVTGSVTADGATIDGAIIVNGSGVNLDNAYGLSWGDGSAQVRGSGSSEAVELLTSSVVRLNADADGDISFYNSAGNSKDLFWDASSSRLGLGTTSPQRPLHLDIGTDNTAARFQSTDTEVALEFIDPAGTAYFRASGDYIKMGATQSDSLTILDGGNVGIGTNSIDNKVNIQESALSGRGASNGNTSLTIEHATDTGIQFFSATQTQIRFGDAASTGAGSIIYDHTTDKLRLNYGQQITFEDDGTTRMLIDSSGNAVIGDTTAKTRLQSSGKGSANAPSLGSVSSNAPLYLTNSDTAYGLVAGTNSSDGHVWLQAQRTDGTATAYNITLNEAGGNVGIGVASPNHKLDVVGEATFGSGSYGVKLSYSNSATAGVIDTADSADKLSIRTGGTERMRIDSSGVDITNGHINLSAGYSLQWGDSHERIEQSDQNLEFFTNNSQQMTIKGSNVGIGTTNPVFGLSVESDNGSGYAALFRKSDSDPALTIQTTSGVTQIQALNSTLNATHPIAMQLSGGNVGIGVASPSYPLEIQSGGVGTVLRAGTSFISIDSTGSAASPSLIFNGDDDTGIYRPASDTLAVVTGGTERMRIDSSGHLNLKKNLVLESTSEGIDFGGVGSSAQTLDDYEEGIFTPVMTGVSGWSLTTVGYYRKVGSLVTVVINFTSNSALTGTPSNTITGLPFSNSISERGSNVSLSRMFGVDLTDSNYIAGVNGTTLDFGTVGGGNSANNFTVSGSTLRFTCSATYITS